MLLVAVFSARFARRNLDIISTSAPFLAVCGVFFFAAQCGWALDDEEFFIVEGSG